MTSMVFAGAERVKTIAVRQTNDSSPIELTKASMLDGSYPIARPLGFCYDQSNTKPGVVEFIEFCRVRASAMK
jgi:hypothetical protein